MPLIAMLLGLVAALAPTSALAAPGEEITVAAAISLRDALADAGAAFTRDTAIQVRLTFGASGQLATQIEQGAPIDLFISAAGKQVDELIVAGAVDPASRRVVAGNTLVLIVPADAKDPPDGFAALQEARFQRIAVGQPKTVPAGEYAMQVLAKLGLSDALRPRLVYAGNVRQVLDYVERAEVSAGIVYRTDAMEAGERVRVVATADAALHDVIVYPAAIVRASRRGAAAKRFLDFLTSPSGQAILAKRGFLPPAAGTPGTAAASAPSESR
jgi:molybdate transport system substrate-binding protein